MANEQAANELALKTADTDVKILSGLEGIREISALSADVVLIPLWACGTHSHPYGY